MRELDLSYNYNLMDISPLSALTDLEKLNLYKINITNVEPLKNLINLEELNLYGNKNLSDITPLSNLISDKFLFPYKFSSSRLIKFIWK